MKNRSRLGRLIKIKHLLLTSFFSIYEMKDNQEKIKRVQLLINQINLQQ